MFGLKSFRAKANEDIPLKKAIPQIILYIIVGYILAQLFMRFVGIVGHIPSESMTPTFQVGDRVVASPIPYFMGEIERGDMIVFDGGNDRFLKRVIGLPNDVIDIKDGHFLVNGEPLDETAYIESTVQTFADHRGNMVYPYTVPLDAYFVAGDNRTGSVDSRYFGAIPESSIVGKALCRVYPLNRVGKVD